MTEENNQIKDKNNKQKYLFLLAGVLVGCAIGHYGTKLYIQHQIKSAFKSIESPFKKMVESRKSIEDMQKEIDLENQKWKYDKLEDEMRGTFKHIAKISSTNKHSSVGFGDGDPLTLVFRWDEDENKSGELNALVTTGNYNSCLSDEECYISVKADNKEIETFKYSVNSGLSTVMFIDDKERLLDLVKNSKKLIIEVTFTGNSKKQYTINSEGLVWDWK